MCRASPFLELTANPLYSQVKYQTSLFSPRDFCALQRIWEHLVSCVWLLLGFLAFLQQQQQTICLEEKHLLLYSKILSRNLEGFRLDSKPGNHLTLRMNRG